MKDIRWEQRFLNFTKALEKLAEAVDYFKDFHSGQRFEEKDKLEEILKEGLIQRFEYTHELAWNVMRDFMMYSGNTEIYGSKDATRHAFKAGLIQNGDIWMEMIRSRNLTSHTYNEETANEIFDRITQSYFGEFELFKSKMEEIRMKEG